ncbi:unnamed protein product [Cuscuta europaea]|uniref:CASP-like protein n=1 Tax=Cuscuta europaea TaxID=41803 RepID=A0A9P0YZH0_CUSEU|nr:unnamed protein product [Cuscuta europaea]
MEAMEERGHRRLMWIGMWRRLAFGLVVFVQSFGQEMEATHGHIQVKKEEYEVMETHPPPDLPPWRNCTTRVWKTVLPFLVFYFQSSLFYHFYFVSTMTNNKRGRRVFCFALVDRLLVGGNQVDTAANSLYALTASAISLAVFRVDYSMSGHDVRRPMGFGFDWIEGDLVLGVCYWFGSFDLI